MSREEFDTFKPKQTELDVATYTRRDGSDGFVGQKISVRNISPNVDLQTLRNYMRAAGDVDFAKIVPAEEGGGHAGDLAVVGYTFPEDAAIALMTLDRTELDGMEIALFAFREDPILKRFNASLRRAAIDEAKTLSDPNSSHGASDLVPVSVGDDGTVVGRQVVLRSLAPSTSSNGVKERFAEFGDILQVNVNRAQHTGKIVYASPQSAAAAIKALHNQDLHGSVIEVCPDPDDPLLQQAANGSEAGT